VYDVDTVEMGRSDEQIVLDMRLQLSVELPCLGRSDIVSVLQEEHPYPPLLIWK